MFESNVMDFFKLCLVMYSHVYSFLTFEFAAVFTSEVKPILISNHSKFTWML